MINKISKIMKLPFGGYCTIAFYWIVSVAAVMLIMTAISEISVDNEPKKYCEMVEIYQATNGKYGWPDYNKNYKEACGDDRK